MYQSPTGQYENVMLSKFEKLKLNIGRSIGFEEINKGVSYADRYTVLSRSRLNQDPRNYMSIDQAPTTREGGFGNMYHYSWDTHSLWYHTFALQKFEPGEKEKLPNACTVAPVGKSPIPLGKSSKIEVQVKLTGSIEDKLVVGSEQGEALFYTRKDVSNWYLKYRAQDNQMKYLTTANKAHGVVLKDNTASGVVTLALDTNKFDKSNPKQWTYTVHAEANSLFYNHTASDPSEQTGICSTTLTFDAPQNGTMLSDFTVIENISVDRKSSLVPAMLGYQDASYGDDADFYTFDIQSVDDSSRIVKRYDPAIPGVRKPKSGYLDQEAVNEWLLGFIQSKFMEETTAATKTRKFLITQTITDKDVAVNGKSTATKTVIVTQFPNTPWAPGCETLTHEWPAPAQLISPETSWPEDWWDVVPMPVSDAAPNYVPHRMCDEPVGYEQFERRVYVDDKEIDAAKFFAGSFQFGEAAVGLRKITVTYTAPDGHVSHKTQHVVVHESKPRVAIQLEGLYKENRTMKARNISAASNDAWSEQTAPMETVSFSFVNTANPDLKCRTGFCESNLQEKTFMYKKTGNYQMSISAKRVIPYGNGKSVTRYSDPYIVQYEVQPDHKPAIVAHAYGSQISRLDQLEINYQVESTDGDFIAEKHLQIWYDSNNDGAFDTKVYEKSGDIAVLPKFGKLGQYQIIADAKEGTTQDRLQEHITAADDRTHRSYAYFFIDNYAPSSDLYLDVPTEKPDLDIFFLLDSSLKQSSIDYVLNNKVAITNQFTTSNMRANVGIWDMKTYTYSQSASTNRNTGSAYPSETTSYSSGDGYSGALTRTSVQNSPYSRDEGKYVTAQDSKTATDTCSNTETWSYDSKGTSKGSSYSSSCPGSMSYNSGGYSGTLSRGSTSSSGSCPWSGGPKNGSCSVTYTANYSGTVYGTKQVWEPRMVSYDNYTGYYSGTIYKNIRQPYNPSFLRAVPGKYIIYISDGAVSPHDLPDVRMVQSKQAAEIIAIGNETIRSQLPDAQYIPMSQSMDIVIATVIAHIAAHNPAIPKVLKLVGEPIETRTATFDAERDELPEASDVMQIIQDPNYYDNSLGYDTFAGKRLVSVKLAANWSLYRESVTLTKPGKYTFLRKVKDKPTSDPNFPGYEYESNESAIEVFVHRKPIADVSLDFDYMTASGTYKTAWIDMSYDLDHNITRSATDRGIRTRSVKFTNSATGEVFTAVPDMLPPGAYKLEYLVQDIEGAWSSPLERTFVLPDTVPVQMKSNLKTEYSGFSLLSVPASERLIAHGLWTRFPYSISLDFAMGGYISRSVAYYTGTKNGNDISWRDESFTIPATVPDGTYSFAVTALGSTGGSRATQTYTVRVATPIQLTGSIRSQVETRDAVNVLAANESYTIASGTTKYANAVTVTAFKGTGHQRSLSLIQSSLHSTGYGAKAWAATMNIGSVPDGAYTFEWRAATPNGNIETVSQVVQVVNNRPPSGDFNWLPSPVYEGDTVQFKTIVNDADRDTLDVAYEITGPLTGSSKQTFAYKLAYPYAGTAPLLKLPSAGSWAVKMTVSDGRAAPVTLTKTVRVLPLAIAGSVKHTPEWDKLRQAHNVKASGKPEQPRGYGVFWAGEKFMLEADTTATGTATQASRVEVEMDDGNKAYKAVLQPASPANDRWRGELWDEAFGKLPDGALSFIFTVYYSNGTVKTEIVDIVVGGNARSVAGVHRMH